MRYRRSLSALIFVKDNLLIVGAARCFSGEHVGNLHDFVPCDHALVYRPINVALLGIDGLRFRERDDEVAALSVPSSISRRGAARLPLFTNSILLPTTEIMYCPSSNQEPSMHRNVRISHAENDVDVLRRQLRRSTGCTVTLVFAMIFLAKPSR